MPPHQTIAGERLTGFRRNSLNAAECFISGTQIPPGNLSGAIVGPPSVNLGTGATANVDWNVPGVQRVAPAGATLTVTFSNTADGGIVNLAIFNPAAITITFPTVVWSGGSQPTPTVTKLDVYTFMKLGSTVYGTAKLNF